MSDKKRKKKIMKRKLIPAFLMLSVGAISSIVMRMYGYETNDMLKALLGILVIFYIVGSLFTMMLNIFDRQNQPEEAVAEGEAADRAEAADMEEGQVKAEG